MTEAELQEIEKQFSAVLHTDYRKLVLDTPVKLIALLEAVAEENTEAETMLFRTVEYLAGTNEWVRDPDDNFEFNPNDDTVPWPKDWFVIGGDVGGNLYCVKTDSDMPSPSVYFWYQGTTELEIVSEDIAGFVRAIFETYGT